MIFKIILVQTYSNHICLSIFRSSRDNKPTNQQSQKVGRQTSADPSKSRDSEADMDTSNFAIDRISTMSLGEFKNLLNTTLTVPNGTDSQCSSDSPRSQTSTDVSRTVSKQVNKSTPTKSAYSYRSVSANRSPATKTSTKPTIPTKPYLVGTGTGSRGLNGTQTLTNGITKQPNRTASSTSIRSIGSTSSNYGQDRPKTPSSLTKSKSNTSSISDNSITIHSVGKTAQTSRSSSHSSLQSYESTDDGKNSLAVDLANNINAKPVLSPSSVDSDYSFRGSSGTSSEYMRSNSYTPCSMADDKNRLDHLRSFETRSSSEPRDVQSVPVSEKPINVGYASFSYQNDSDTKDCNELDDIENEIANAKRAFEECLAIDDETTDVQKSADMRPQTPSGRTTPSLIPRPITPKISRKMSLPQNENDTSIHDEKSRTGRPPTPRKSNILARAHNSSVRSADKSKEQTYKEIFQKRSTTPGPGSSSRSGSSSVAMVRRSMTPGPYLQKTSSLKNASATTSRELFKEANDLNKTVPLSVYSGQRDNTIISNKRSASVERKSLTKQKSVGQGETVIMVNVDRSDNKHSIAVQGEDEKRANTNVTNTNKTKVLARARTDDSRSRTVARSMPGTPRKRPQSVEPRQLVPGKDTSLKVKNGVNGEPDSYDRTQEWVQTAVEQTKVQKKVKKTTFNPRMRRAMTPNSFDMRMDAEDEEPRTLDEIKAALTLPFDKIETINPHQLDAPPEDPEMYATMEKLFHELRQQELKNSVNETPGSTTESKGIKTKSKSSRSNSSTNDEEMSLDSNKNIKRSAYSISTKSSSNVTSPSVKRSDKVTSQTVTRSKPTSRTSSVSSTGLSQTNGTRPSSAASKRTPLSTRPSSPSLGLTAKCPPSPRTQPPRPSSPRVTAHPPRPASPRVTSHPPRPASPRVMSHPPRPASQRVSPHTSRPASPRTTVSSTSSCYSTPVRKQPPRPASTPPRPSTPIKRQSSRSSDDTDNVFTERYTKPTDLIHKIKELINVKPRKDKVDGIKQKTRIPAPKSLKDAGRSRSVSNLGSLDNSLPLSPTNKEFDLDNEMNGYSEHMNGGPNNSTIARSETPGPKWATPLTTGRSSLIRKESMEKNKNSRLVRAVSVERNINGLSNSYSFCEDGEYV